MSPKVSIILTTHGEARYLKQAIGSVLAQTFEDWELIIACDGPLLVEPQPYGWGISDHRMKQPVFEVPSETRCRFASTINQAFKLCRGEFVTYLCHDDLYLPWRLEMMLWGLEWEKSWDIVFGHQKLVTSDCKEQPNGAIRIGSEDQPAGTVDHSSVMHRRECFDAAGGWDETCPPRYGDAYFWIRLQQAGFKFHCIPEVLDAHRFNPHSISWKEDHPEQKHSGSLLGGANWQIS